MNEITISWVRHAESTANILEGNITDFYDFMETTGGKRPIKNSNYIPDDNYGVDSFSTDFIDKLKDTEIEENKDFIELIKKDIALFKESPNFKLYEKIHDLCKNKANKDEIKNIKKNINPKLKMDACKMGEDIKKFNLDLWGNEKISDEDLQKFSTSWKIIGADMKPPGTWFFTPTLTYNGVRQAQQLGTDYLKNKNYDLMICSASVRTIMTALFSILSSDIDLNDKKLYIVPYINEKYNGAGYFDRANASIPPMIIHKVIDLILNFVREKMPEQPIKSDFIDPTPYIHEMKGKDIHVFSEGDYERFLEHFLPTFLNNHKDKKNILTFSHGKNIDEDVKKTVDETIKKAFFPNNCSVWDVKYKKNINKYEFDDNTSSDYDISIISGKYFNRDTTDADGKLLFPLSVSFPLPSYLGSFARRTVEDFKMEKSNLTENNWSSLKKGNLRGDINDLWIKCLNEEGNFICDVKYQAAEYEKQIETTGGRKTKRRRKNTRKHIRKHKLKTKRRQKRKSKRN
jgi:hypothetical protein